MIQRESPKHRGLSMLAGGAGGDAAGAPVGVRNLALGPSSVASYVAVAKSLDFSEPSWINDTCPTNTLYSWKVAVMSPFPPSLPIKSFLWRDSASALLPQGWSPNQNNSMFWKAIFPRPGTSGGHGALCRSFLPWSTVRQHSQRSSDMRVRQDTWKAATTLTARPHLQSF